MTCDHSNCNQGRDCPDAHMATRRVFWLEPSEPVGYEAAWKPEPEPEAPHPWGFYVFCALVLLALFGSPAFFI